MAPAKGNGENLVDERRQFRRFAMRVSAETLRDDTKKSAQTRKTRTFEVNLQDFSLGGLGITSKKRLKKQESLTVRIPPRGKRPQIDLTGRVIHCRRDRDRYYVGIEFCHTKKPLETSPWLRMPSLFQLARATRRIDA